MDENKQEMSFDDINDDVIRFDNSGIPMSPNSTKVKKQKVLAKDFVPNAQQPIVDTEVERKHEQTERKHEQTDRKHSIIDALKRSKVSVSVDISFDGISQDVFSSLKESMKDSKDVEYIIERMVDDIPKEYIKNSIKKEIGKFYDTPNTQG